MSGTSKEENGCSAVANVVQPVARIGLFTTGAPASTAHPNDGSCRKRSMRNDPCPATTSVHPNVSDEMSTPTSDAVVPSVLHAVWIA